MGGIAFGYTLAVPTIGDNLKRLRLERGLTQEALAKAAGVKQNNVSKYELGRSRPNGTSLRKIATGLRVSLDELLKGVDSSYDSVVQPTESSGHGTPRVEAGAPHEADELDIDVSDGYKRHHIPVIAEGDASPTPNLFWDDDGLRSDVEEKISRPFDVRDPRAYGVKVRGDSMMPRYRPGEVLVVSPNIPVQDGDEVYVTLLNGERLLKVARRADGGWILESENHAYPARLVKQSEIGTMHPVLWIRPKRR